MSSNRSPDAALPGLPDRAKLEKALGDRLGRFLHFDSLDVYYPALPLSAPEYLPDEDRLLFPLPNEARAAIRLDGFKPGNGRFAAEEIGALIDLCLEIAQLERRLEHDDETGLLKESAFLQLLAQKISTGPATQCLGLVIMHLKNAPSIRKELGETEFLSLWKSFANAMREHLAPDSYPSRIGLLEGRYEFGILLNATGRGQCQKLACSIISAIEQHKLPVSLSGIRLSPHLLGGHAIYPQDIAWREAKLAPFELALLLRNRARLAAEAAGFAGLGSALAWAWLPARAGRIVEKISQNQVRINLGSLASIRPGQRFNVLEPGESFESSSGKAQLIVCNVGETDSVAEIFHLDRADMPPREGDRLFSYDSGHSHASLPGQSEFLADFEKLRESSRAFTLSITEFQASNNGAKTSELIGPFIRHLLAAKSREICIGRYGRNSLIFFHPDSAPQASRDYFNALHINARDMGLTAATGIFGWPFLNFAKRDSEGCALKALSYAVLLPEPHIGTLDSIALTISADKRYSLGDELGAMKEYELALLLKPDEPLALNSLGVCMASLNRFEQAKELFSKALAAGPAADLRAKILYNIGNIFQKEREPRNALKFMRECIRADKKHIFAWIKYGNIFREAGRHKAARAAYRYATRLARDDRRIMNIIQRQLARLECESSKTEEARAILHDTLLRNPADHASMILLGETYLADDPGTAELLARKSIKLGGNGWSLLAKALACMGRDKEAKEAAARAI